MRKQNIKYVPLSKYISIAKNNKPSSFLDNLIKIVGLISAATAIFIALFYIFGRKYAIGYFGAMDIPEYMVTFSMWEYGAVAWFPLVFLVFISTITFIVFPFLELLFSKPIKAIGNVLSKKRKRKHEVKNPFIKENYEPIKQILFGIVILAGCFMFYQGLKITTNIGAITGEYYLLNNANIVELHSMSPHTINDRKIINSGSNRDSYYVYEGFRLLTINNGKYYLFKELNPETCKPERVYIIDEASVDQVILSPAEDLTNICQ
ncbi:MAG: hypothetical protein JEZ00_15450 [Anaerolineaceae bacterium]|nr:hypothetical protein [Anaerolineaceae bacterium]